MQKLLCMLVLIVVASLAQANMVPNGDFEAERSYWNFSGGAWVESADHPEYPDMKCGRLENGDGGPQDIRSNLFAVPNVSDFIFSFNSGVWQETTEDLHPVFQVRFYGSKDHSDIIGDVKFDIQQGEGDWGGLKTENSGQFTAPAGTKYMDVVITVGQHNAWQGGSRIGNIVLDTPDGLGPSDGALPIYFDITEPGVTKRLDYWGMDQTWIDGWNMDQAIDRIGHEDFNVVRINFLATTPLTYDADGNPQLTDTMKDFVGRGMDQAMKVPTANLAMHLTAKHDLHEWYVGADGLIIPERKVDGAVAMINYIEDTYGYTIDRWDFVEVINEPDWEYPYSNPDNMAAIMAEFRNRSELDSIPLLGPSTLCSDAAYHWYYGTSDYTDIGGTHVINGSMESYIGFIQWIHSDGKLFINPEWHSFIELMIQADLSGDRPGEGGVFWHHVTPEEGRFIQACKGKRIAYEVDPVTWSGTSVYRDLDGRIWLFAGSNERHAQDSKWEFISTDREVFFDGVGPANRKTITMGKHDYWHAEVTWGDRNPPYYSQYVDNMGENIRMAVSNGEVVEISPDNTDDFAQWKFRSTGAFYYIDNAGAKDAGQNFRLTASKDILTVGLGCEAANDDFAKWQLVETDGSFYLENVGMQRAGLASRLKADSLILTDSSNTTSWAQWSFFNTGLGYANLVPNGDFLDGSAGWNWGEKGGVNVNPLDENMYMDLNPEHWGIDPVESYLDYVDDYGAWARSGRFNVSEGMILDYSVTFGTWVSTETWDPPVVQENGYLVQLSFFDSDGVFLENVLLEEISHHTGFGEETLTGSIVAPAGAAEADVYLSNSWYNDYVGAVEILNVMVTEVPDFYPGDFNKDGSVNFLDLAVIGQAWLTVYDIDDLQTLANDWLKIGP